MLIEEIVCDFINHVSTKYLSVNWVCVSRASESIERVARSNSEFEKVCLSREHKARPQPPQSTTKNNRTWHYSAVADELEHQRSWDLPAPQTQVWDSSGSPAWLHEANARGRGLVERRGGPAAGGELRGLGCRP